jgi:hypothetical protein
MVDLKRWRRLQKLTSDVALTTKESPPQEERPAWVGANTGTPFSRRKYFGGQLGYAESALEVGFALVRLIGPPYRGALNGKRS